MTTLELRCLGALTFIEDGIPIPDLKSSKGKALLCYLAVNGKRFTRSALAGMFWMDMPESQALMNLRKVLNRLKPLSPYLLIDHDTLAFNQNALFWLDVKEFESAASAQSDVQRLQYAVSLYQGDFLDGFNSDEMPSFADWAGSQRVRLRELALTSLQNLIAHFMGQSNYPVAIHFTRLLLKIEAWNEEAHRELIQLLSLTGQRSEAIKQYETCRRVLKEELGIEPAPATLDLVQGIIAHTTGRNGTGVADTVTYNPSAIPHNLPAQLTSFIGRQKEIRDLRFLLTKNDPRLVTLTGSGGTGKTRLALQVAVELLDVFVDGVWVVELASLSDPLLVPQTVISALGLIELPGKTPVAQLVDFLRNKKLLLILDNCEHLSAACAELAARLLQSTPQLTILATSRELLGVLGEVLFRVPPLGTPDSRRLPPPEQLAQYDAVRLFSERAQGFDPGFALTEDNAVAVTQITQRLNGIPLAIELAAARLRLMSAEQIVLRLNDVFQLLTGGSRTVLPRHQTLKALIDWSYNLLSEEERRLLRHLSAFSGGWTLEAAEGVCEGSIDILYLLGQLVDKSVILSEPTQTKEKRFRMLETVRQYAHDRLVEAGETEEVRGRHLDYYLRLAERLEPSLRSREQIATLDFLGGELDNLRLALEWALRTNVEAGLRLAASLQWFWHIRYHWSEGITWLKRGLEAEKIGRGDQPPVGPGAMIRAKALTALGFHVMMRDQPDVAKAIVLLDEALILYRGRDPEHRRGMAWTFVWYANCRSETGHPVEARFLAEEALSLFRESGDAHGMAESLQEIGILENDPEMQKKINIEYLAIEEANGDIEGIANGLTTMGLTSFLDGDYESALVAFEEGREHYLRTSNLVMVSHLGFLISFALLHQGNLESAELYLDKALNDFQEMAHEVQVVHCLFWKGMIAFAQGRYTKVADVNEDIARIARKTGNPLIYNDMLYQRVRLARLRGDPAAAQAFAQESLTASSEFGYSKMLVVLEMGHLALQCGDKTQARALLREGGQLLTRRNFLDIFFLGLPLDGLAVLAVREGKMERAARLFGTRLWRGINHILSPIERAGREADFAEIKAALEDERFSQLREEGYALTFKQVQALAYDEG